MTQRTLYKAIEKVGANEFSSVSEMLVTVLQQILSYDRLNLIGGRIWKLHPEEKQYELMYEDGNIENVGSGFRLRLKDNPVFDEVAKRRTILADETNRELRRKGIIKYSATGIGESVKIGKHSYYEYLMAFNTVRQDNELRYQLSIAGQAVTQLLHNRKTEAIKRSLENEMELASQLQRQILPAHEYHFGNFELYGVSVPERIVGGDFFNYYEIPGDQSRLAVAIGDATSKGFPAAVQALFVSGALMMSVEFESKIASMLRRINTINRKIFPPDRLLTLFYCELVDGKDGLMLYSNAGHCLPIHYHASDQSCTELSVTGPVIGLMEDAKFGLTNSNIAVGDVLVLFTDGITEAYNGEVEYGEQRLMTRIRETAMESSKHIALHILQDAQTYSKIGTYADDKTIVIIKRVK